MGGQAQKSGFGGRIIRDPGAFTSDDFIYCSQVIVAGTLHGKLQSTVFLVQTGLTVVVSSLSFKHEQQPAASIIAGLP